MNPGILDRRVTLQSLSVTRDSFGGQVETWADVVTVWASVKPLRGDEVYDATGKIAQRAVEIKIRYREDVTTLLRLQYEAANYDITDVSELGRRDGLKLVCQQRRGETDGSS